MIPLDALDTQITEAAKRALAEIGGTEMNDQMNDYCDEDASFESASRQIQRDRREFWIGCVKEAMHGKTAYLDAVYAADQALASYDERVKDGRL